MFDVRDAVRVYVLEDPAIDAKVDRRMYPTKLPQNALLPAITLRRISGVRFPALRGRAGLARPRYQFDVWTREGVEGAAEEAGVIGRLLLARLEGKNVELLDESESPAVLRRVAFEFIDDEDLFEPGVNGGYFRYRADFYIWHHTGN